MAKAMSEQQQQQELQIIIGKEAQQQHQQQQLQHHVDASSSSSAAAAAAVTQQQQQQQQQLEELPIHSEIQRLNADTIRRISAEQAISDLSSIVKELVDNSLDAESTTIKSTLLFLFCLLLLLLLCFFPIRPMNNIILTLIQLRKLTFFFRFSSLSLPSPPEVRLFGQGLDIIEVSDDGCGVPEASRPYMATKHATSKITSIDDIYSGTGLTMGFRGEALFSMACVSKQLVVATRTDAEELATKIVFGKDGLPVPDQQQQFARKVGTTVAVVEPYGSLPARRADLMRRIRGERTKIFKLIEAYGIFNVGVCFQLLDIVSSGSGSREDTMLATSANSETLEETVSTLLGRKFLQSMTPVEVSFDSVLTRIYGENMYSWGVQGLISTEPSVQQASQQHDKGIANNKKNNSPHQNRCVQYFCINGRVVELPKATELLRKLWKSFGGKKKPSAILSFTLPNEAFDINLAPDKQTVLLTHEKEIMALIEQYVINLWSGSSSGVFAVSHVPTNEGVKIDGKGKDKDNEMEDDDDDDDEDRQMHKRRFAFVHDPAKAKMQHELDERRMNHENDHAEENTPEVTDNNESGDDTDNRVTAFQPSRSKEEPPHKKSKTNDASTPDLSGNEPVAEFRRIVSGSEPDRSTGSTSAKRPLDQISDAQRREWINIQSKFRRRGSGEDGDTSMQLEINALCTTSNVNVAPVSLDELDPAPATKNSVNDHSSSQLPQKETTSKNGALSTNSHLSNLKKFAFQPESRGNSSRHASFSQPKISHMLEPTSSQKPVTTESPAISSEALGRTEPVEGANRKKRPSPVPADLDTEDSKGHSKKNDSERDPRETESSPEEDTPESPKVPDSVVKPEAIVWKAFQSTEQVCQSAREERLKMLQRKHGIDMIRRTLAKESQKLSATIDKNTQPEEGPGNEVDKKVAFDGDEDDGGDNSSTSAPFIRISKSTFRNGMQVIGQFNLGFILAKCSRNHLWILDQHACDEKYNFEQLCKNTVIHEQPLIKPLHLELSPAEEACVLDHMDIFEANGFKFAFDPNAPIRHRLSLKALPHSGAHEGRKAVQFGPSDVSALCSILTEGSSYDPGAGGTGTEGNGMYGNNAVRRHASSTSSDGKKGDTADKILARLPKAIAMFASRACRTSIMIGTALSKREMDAVVQKLAQVDMPWNCPHGRPTMRHVAELLPVLWKDERRAAEYIATPTITVTPLTQPAEE
jgi:DNA mismatch repair protein PMS2